MRVTPLLVALCVFAGPAFAQIINKKAAQPLPDQQSALQRQEQPAAPKGRLPDSKVERIRVEDSRARIDETRYGGVTQNITVQPRGTDLPSYEVLPNDTTRSSTGAGAGEHNATNQGPRVWKFLNF